MRLALKLLEAMVPSFTARRVAHLDFTKARVEKRLEMKTDRKDIMSNASLVAPHYLPGSNVAPS